MQVLEEQTKGAVLERQKACLTCENWKPRGNKEMAKHRFAICELGPRWEYLPPLQTCERHKLAGADVVAARVEWAAKS